MSIKWKAPLTFIQFHILTVGDTLINLSMHRGILGNTIVSRFRLHLPLSQSARRPPVQWVLPGKRQQAGSGSLGPAGPDGASSSVGPFPPSDPPPSAALHRTPALDLSGSQRNCTATVLKSFTLERSEVGLNGAAWVFYFILILHF